jgi:hypothetical protein
MAFIIYSEEIPRNNKPSCLFYIVFAYAHKLLQMGSSAKQIYITNIVKDFLENSQGLKSVIGTAFIQNDAQKVAYLATKRFHFSFI